MSSTLLTARKVFISSSSSAAERGFKGQMEQTPDITLTPQPSKFTRPRSPLRTSFVPCQTECSSDCSLMPALSQDFLDTIEFKTPAKLSATSLEELDLRSPLLTPPLSDCSVDSRALQPSPLLPAVELSDCSIHLQGKANEHLQRLQSSTNIQGPKPCEWDWESSTSTSCETGQVQAQVHPSAQTVAATDDSALSLLPNAAYTCFQHSSPSLDDSKDPAKASLQHDSSKTLSFDSYDTIVSPLPRRVPVGCQDPVPADQYRVLLGQLRELVGSVGLLDQNTSGLAKGHQQFATSCYPVSDWTSNEDHRRTQSSSARLPCERSGIVNGSRSREIRNKRASWQSISSESSSTFGAQMPFDTTTSSGTSLVAAFAEKVTELESVNRAILEERDYLEGRVQIAESEKERMREELKAARDPMRIARKQESEIRSLSSATNMIRLRPHRTVSADDCPRSLDTDDSSKNNLASCTSGPRPFSIDSQGHRRSIILSQVASGTRHDVDIKHDHTRTLSLVEKINRQRTSQRPANRQLIATDLMDTVERSPSEASAHVLRRPESPALLLDQSRNFSSNRSALEEYRLARGQMVPYDPAYQYKIEERKLRQDDETAGESDTDARALVPAASGLLRSRPPKVTSNSRALLKARDRPEHSTVGRERQYRHLERHKTLDHTPLASSDLLSSFEGVLAPIESASSSIGAFKDKLMAFAISCFVWIQFAGCLIVAISMTMYRGPLAAGLATGSTSPKRLPAASRLAQERKDKVFPPTQGSRQASNGHAEAELELRRLRRG